MSVRLFNNMIGKTIAKVNGKKGYNEMVFIATDGSWFHFYHEQDCCESVDIEDICGDLDDLIGTPITMAEEVSNIDDVPVDMGCHDSYTWTFYKFGTNRGTVTVRWFGTSNGYYCEVPQYKEHLTTEGK